MYILKIVVIARYGDKLGFSIQALCALFLPLFSLWLYLSFLFLQLGITHMLGRERPYHVISAMDVPY